MPPLRSLLVLLFLLACAPRVQAQQADADRSTTERRLEQLREQIRQTEAALSETRKLEQASMERLERLDREVRVREELAGSYRQRLRQLNAETDTIRASITLLEDDVAELRRQYRRRASHAYRHGRLHDLALILSARSINEMLVRVQYLNRFTDERREKLTDIREATQELSARQRALDSTRARTRTLLAEAEREQENLAELRQTRTRMAQELKAQGADQEQSLTEMRKTKQELERRLREYITAAAQRDRNTLSAEDAAALSALSGSFEQNRGRLPWPAQGVVTEPFGEVVNPVHGTRTSNPGVLITSAPSAEVRAVFKGEVIGVDAMPEFGTYVVIRHGDRYQSLYSNFSMVYVGAGQYVEAEQVIGRAGTESAPKGPGVFFGLFEQGQEFDPRAWLRPQ